MLKAGALLYAIFVTLIVALLTMSILWGHYYGTIQIQNSIERNQRQSNIKSAINKILIFPDSLTYNQDTEFSPFNDEQTVSLKKIHWGMYDLITGKTVFKNDTIKLWTLLGQSIFDGDSLALYVCDQDKDVYICGNILIKGRCYIPKALFKHGYISSQQLTAAKTLPDNLNKSETTLPAINSVSFNYNKDLLYQKESLPTQHDLSDFLSGKDSVVVPFDEPTLILYCQDLFTLHHITLSGNIILLSSQTISIEKTANIDKVLIYAPTIKLQNEVKGNMQLFATDSIIIGENCLLQYPSSIMVISPNISHIIIKRNSKVLGNVIQYQEDTNSRNSLVNIEEGVQIYGVIYSNAYVQQKGRIYGSLYAEHLYLKTNSGYYENYLMDMEINFEKLSKSYVSCNLFKDKKQRILSWQY